MLSEHTLAIHKHLDYQYLGRREHRRRLRLLTELIAVFNRFAGVDFVGLPTRFVTQRAILRTRTLSLTFFELGTGEMGWRKNGLDKIVAWLHHHNADPPAVGMPKPPAALARPRFLKFPDCDDEITIAFVSLAMQVLYLLVYLPLTTTSSRVA